MSDGTVTGGPRAWLRLEGLLGLAAAVAAFLATGQAWWLLPLLLLVPDVAMLGYLRGPRTGAHAYNLAHSVPAPAVLASVGVWTHHPLVLALSLVWLAHIGFDRMFGYGLKYEDEFVHTHLGRIGPQR